MNVGIRLGVSKSTPKRTVMSPLIASHRDYAVPKMVSASIQNWAVERLVFVKMMVTADLKTTGALLLNMAAKNLLLAKKKASVNPKSLNSKTIPSALKLVA